jgi:hypothetical protein
VGDNEAKPWFSRVFEPTDVSINVGDGQQPRLRLRATISTYRRVPDGQTDKDIKWFEWYIKVAVDGTTVQPGKLIWEKDDKRGYYTDSVLLRIWFDSQTEEKPRSTEAKWVIAWDSPDSTPRGGSSSESKSISASAGFFGTTLTANYSESISSGTVQSFPDFEIVNSTGPSGRPGVVEHAYELRLVEGSEYHNPTDLIDIDYKAKTGRVRNLSSQRATSNLKIPSSVLFHNTNSNNSGRVKSRLSIALEQRLVAVEKSWAPIAWLPLMSPIPVKHRYERNLPSPTRIPLGTGAGFILTDIYSCRNAHTWQFDIDMQNGQVTETVVPTPPGRARLVPRHG